MASVNTKSKIDTSLFVEESHLGIKYIESNIFRRYRREKSL